eukprot:2271717-Prymnesium_polylepis.1
MPRAACHKQRVCARVSVRIARRRALVVVEHDHLGARAHALAAAALAALAGRLLGRLPPTPRRAVIPRSGDVPIPQ